KATSEAWYQRALNVAKTFTVGQPAEKNLNHAILLATYKVFRSGDYADRIHTTSLLEELLQLGIPKWVDANHLSNYLSGYDPTIKPRQMKIDGFNRNGYDWHTFMDSWNTYISDNERAEVDNELGLTPLADAVDMVDSRMVPQQRSPHCSTLARW